MEILKPCCGCGGLFADIAGPTHRYMESSPGCWAAYGDVLAREYSDPACYTVHRLTVDTYAAQHPGKPSPQSIQSVALHLVRLCLLLEHGLSAERANAAMLAAAEPAARRGYRWLTPPATLAAITVADVRFAEDAEQHKKLVRAWAASVWAAWSAHHAAVYGWLPEGC